MLSDDRRRSPFTFGSKTSRHMTRNQIHAQFAAEFHRGSLPECVSPAALDSLEQELGMMFPESYRLFLLQQGPLITPVLADMIAEAREWELPPVLEFFAPSTALATTRRAWMSGLPRNLIAAAKGADQTLFCFERDRKGKRRNDDATVWSFDPLVGVPQRISDSFDAWLQEYVQAVYEDGDYRGDMDEIACRDAGRQLGTRTKP
jgi:hypothetical protein